MIESILQLARQRGSTLPYAGEVTPQEAHQLLQNDATVHLIDVRTNAERDWVGQVQVRPEQIHPVQWNLYPTKSNPDFLNELALAVDQDAVLLFLCRSGVRSKAAAQLATEHGYANCYDILEGFEGDKDADGHRKTVNGWCHAGLPWRGA
ncbi:rhodanese-related sulfurtransferase [Oxalobacteraceae bacterium GrIS 2.11]